MNNYLKLHWYEIVLTLIIFFLGAGIAGQIFSFIARVIKIEPYILTPLATLSNYGLVFLMYYFIGLHPKKEIFGLSYSVKNFHLFPLILILFLGQYLISEYLTGLIPTQGPVLGKLYKIMNDALMGSINEHPYIIFISVCIIAPLFEEIFFRGFILKGMLNNKVNPTKAIVISSLIFGGIHIFPWQVTGGVFAGVILGIAFYRTGSLLICTLLHFLNNLAGFLLFMQYKSLETPELGFNKSILFPFGIVIVLIFGYIYIKSTKNYTWTSY